MNGKILVINGSPRANGNTEMLTDALIEGARQTGGTVTKINLRELDVRPCIGCCKCVEKKGDPCIQKDDMHEIYAAYAECDTLVFASPMYFWTFTAQFKGALDRLFATAAANDMNVPRKNCALLIAAGDASKKNFAPVVSYYESLLENLGWNDVGMVLAGGVNGLGEIAGSPHLEDAKRLGEFLTKGIS